jgi:hypothetical protein
MELGAGGGLHCCRGPQGALFSSYKRLHVAIETGGKLEFW